MLMKCPECELQVSDKALTCPHCGYPLKISNNRARRQPNRRRRLPNGFGQISELKGKNLRKPFRAMVTIGKTDEGKPICKLLRPEAYFETYNDAYSALVEYNKNPYDVSKDLTLGELYERWAENYFKDTQRSSSAYLKGAWNYCSMLKNAKVREIKARHIKQLIEENDKKTTPIVRKNIKTLFNKMFAYAVEYEIIDRNYAKDVLLPKNDLKQMEKERVSHIPFTEHEMELLWENMQEYPIAEVILFQCYSGWRPSELENLETANINLEDHIMVGGMKTEAGKNRVVPIHSRIYPIVEKWYKEAVANGKKYIVGFENDHGPRGEKFTYFRYMRNMYTMMKKLGFDQRHKPHDGRVHFVTMAKKYQMDEYAIKRIVGHTITDITEAVYTKRDNDWLKAEIEKIK